MLLRLAAAVEVVVDVAPFVPSAASELPHTLLGLCEWLLVAFELDTPLWSRGWTAHRSTHQVEEDQG